jgi:hypothetical protein
LRDTVLVCENVEDYIKILGKLQKDKKYKLECESKVKHVINKYTKD